MAFARKSITWSALPYEKAVKAIERPRFYRCTGQGAHLCALVGRVVVLCHHALSMPTCKRGLDHADQFLGRVRRQFNGDACTEAFGCIREIDVDSVLQWRVHRMVKRHADETQVEPPLGAFAPAGNLRCFHDVGAHRCVLLSLRSQAYWGASRCCSKKAQSFFQPSIACSCRYIGRW